ncbi:DMT family transporter [soil metagenome]
MTSPSFPKSSAGHSWRDWAQAHLVVLAWGVTGVIGKLILLPSTEVVVWRTALAVIGFAALAQWLRISLRVTPGVMLRLLGIGLLVGVHWILFFLSARLSNVSVAMVALPTILLWCALLEPLFDRNRRISKLEIVTGLIMMGAVWLIFRAEFSRCLGFAVGLAAAFVASLFVVMNKAFVGRHHFAVVSFYEMIGACIAGLIAVPLFAGAGAAWHLPGASDFFWLLILSMICTVGAYGGYIDILSRMSVFTINVIYNLEPVYGIVLAALTFGSTELMSSGFYIGTIIIMSTVIVMPLLQRRLRTMD